MVEKLQRKKTSRIAALADGPANRSSRGTLVMVDLDQAVDKGTDEEDLAQLSEDWLSERNTLNKTPKSKNSGKSDRLPRSPTL